MLSPQPRHLKVRVERYSSEKHFFLLKEVSRLRGIGDVHLEDLPENGFVALIHDDLIAASFLRRMEGSYALLDGLISNPKEDSACRNAGIHEVVTALMALADTLGIKTVISYSLDAATLERSKSHGFMPMPHTFIVREGKKGVS